MYNPHMKVLGFMTNEELAIEVDFLTEKGWLTEELTSDPYFRECWENDDLPSCVDQIGAEIRLFGGNTVANCWRGGEGPNYKEVATDVCEKLGVDVEPTDRMRDIDRALLEKVLADMWGKMSKAERRDFLESMEIKYDPGCKLKSVGLAALLTAFRAGGFASYQIAVIVANAFAHMVLGHGLSLATNAAITRVLGIAAGPVGMAITAIWLAADLTGPAYRVTVPSVIYLAAMRTMYRYRRHGGTDNEK